jgi:hypothetical protein
MLTGDEFVQLQAVLTQLLALNNGKVWFQTVYAGPSFMVALNELVGPAASDELVAAAAIHACMLREWMDDPCWLVRLLTQVKASAGVGGVGSIPNVDPLIQRLNSKINVLDEVWYTHWVQNGLPFVDRMPLRDTFRDISRSTGRAVLRIEGDPDTGKSYSSQLLEHVSMSSGWSFRVIKVEVENGSEIMMNALSLSQIIVGEMGFPSAASDSPLPDLTVHNIQLLQTWVLRCARASQKRWWLFLDGFGKLPESNSARNLIQGLAEKIANSNYRECLRLVLVDFDKPLSRVEEEQVAFDRPDTRLADPMAQLAIHDCLARLYKELGRTPTAGELLAKTQAVLANIPAGESWIVAVNKRLRAAAKGIRNGQ